jgi:hypothetical protein
MADFDFPDVPDFPGVPSLPRDPNEIIDIAIGLVADALGLTGVGNAPVWGLFLDGEPAIVADSVTAFGFKKGFSVSTYPLEEGSFSSYNKVQRPFTGRLRFATGGSVSDRYEFLASIDAAISSLDLYDIVTPEANYTSVNPIDMDYNRAAVRGAGLLTVDVICEQIRTTASSAFSSATQNQTSTGGTGGAGVDNSSSSGVTGFPAGSVQASSIPDLSSSQLPSATPFVNGGTVQPVNPPSGFDVNAVVQP